MLDRFTGGLLFYYFGNVDQVSHMMWRARDPGHPAYDAVTDTPHAGVVDALYQGLDAIVVETLDRLGPDDLLIVMSDHGFTSWRRAFHMNSWLRDNGYLALIDPNRADDPGFFANVDWSRTRAYAVGLNGLYINVKGRERDGSVEPSARAALAEEIAAKLLATIDPATGRAGDHQGLSPRAGLPARGPGRHRAGFDHRLCEGHARLRRVGARRAAARGDRR